jgi:hypothetical protein
LENNFEFLPFLYFSFGLAATVFFLLTMYKAEKKQQGDLFELVKNDNNINLDEVVKTNRIIFPEVSGYDLELKKKLEKQKLILKDVNLAYVALTFLDLFNSKKSKYKTYFSSGLFFSTKKCPFTVQESKGKDEIYDYIFFIGGVTHRIVIKQNKLDLVLCLFKNNELILSYEAYPMNTSKHYDISYAIATIFNVYITSSKLTDIDLKYLWNIVKLVTPELDEEFNSFLLDKKKEVAREKGIESDARFKNLF